MGAKVLEFHAVYDRRMFGPDSKSSLTIDEISFLVEGVRKIDQSLMAPVDKSDNSAFSALKGIFEKSLAVNKDLTKGHVLTFDDLEAKKPKGFGIEAVNFQKVIGKKLNRDLKKWDFLKDESIR